MRVQLARRERIRQDKERLAALQQVAATTVKVERMLGSSGAELSTDTAERIATDINQLNFAVWKMKVGALCLDKNTSMTHDYYYSFPKVKTHSYLLYILRVIRSVRTSRTFSVRPSVCP